LEVRSERGYLIPAINTDKTDYVACAEQLASSILEWHPTADITILTKEMLPYGDLGGYANDWQCFMASPYRQTIKLEADMYAASPIDHWWTLFENRDVVISQGCRDIYNQPSDARHYRKLFDENRLPDVYNAVTYWRRSHTAKEFFDLVKDVFENWNTYKTFLKFPDEEASTDVVYAVVAAMMGVERVTLPKGLGPSIVHMKRYIIPTMGEDWTDELVWEKTNPGLRIQTVAQQGLVHYHIKDWRIM
jgi:glutaredoxin-related protein